MKTATSGLFTIATAGDYEIFMDSTLPLAIPYSISVEVNGINVLSESGYSTEMYTVFTGKGYLFEVDRQCTYRFSSEYYKNQPIFQRPVAVLSKVEEENIISFGD